jgi:hypothetical protein
VSDGLGQLLLAQPVLQRESEVVAELVGAVSSTSLGATPDRLSGADCFGMS